MSTALDYSNGGSIVCATVPLRHRHDPPTPAIATIEPAVIVGMQRRAFSPADTSACSPDNGVVIVRYVRRGSAKIALKLGLSLAN